jgi:hypothetical protein
MSGELGSKPPLCEYVLRIFGKPRQISSSMKNSTFSTRRSAGLDSKAAPNAGNRF